MEGISVHPSSRLRVVLYPMPQQFPNFQAGRPWEGGVKCFETPHANISFLLRLCAALGLAVDDLPEESRKNRDLSYLSLVGQVSGMSWHGRAA